MASVKSSSDSQTQQNFAEIVKALKEHMRQQNEELQCIQRQNEDILQINGQLLAENEQLRGSPPQNEEITERNHNLLMENIRLREHLARLTNKERADCCCVQIYRYLFPRAQDGRRINEGDDRTLDT